MGGFHGAQAMCVERQPISVKKGICGAAAACRAGVWGAERPVAASGQRVEARHATKQRHWRSFKGRLATARRVAALRARAARGRPAARLAGGRLGPRAPAARAGGAVRGYIGALVPRRRAAPRHRDRLGRRRLTLQHCRPASPAASPLPCGLSAAGRERSCVGARAVVGAPGALGAVAAILIGNRCDRVLAAGASGCRVKRRSCESATARRSRRASYPGGRGRPAAHALTDAPRRPSP